MPFMFCNLNNVCSYAENNDDSIWLTTGEPMPMSMTPIPAREMEKYVSRCVVCDSTTRLIALHSQSMEIPDCPQSWEEAWIGYSYYMQTSDASGNSHQNLISPGSCLEEFRAQPVIECHGRGTCNIFDGITSFWLTVIEDQDQFRKPRQQTLKADQTSKISRCVVCRKMDRSFRARPAVALPNASAFSQREPEYNQPRFDSYRPENTQFFPQPPSTPPPRRRRPNGSRVNQNRLNRVNRSRNQQPVQN
jgi:integrin beta 8